MFMCCNSSKIADGVYDPWEDDQIDINIVIPKRN